MEFELIDTYFKQRFAALSRQSKGVVTGIGDDCAVLQPTAGHQLVVTSDLLTTGRHFFADAAPFALGHKALAVNLSDLAAMGAKPLGFTLSLALGQAEAKWLDAFSLGLLELATASACPLIGGDTTRAQRADDFTVAITAFGEVPAHASPLLRGGAQVNDDVWISGPLGLARMGLLSEAFKRGALPDFLSDSGHKEFLARWSSLSTAQQTQCLKALNEPTPRLELGQALLGLAHAAIDLSDGLAGDLAHLCRASQVGAELFEDALLRSYAQWSNANAVKPVNGPSHVVNPSQTPWGDDLFDLDNQLVGGDDYELCFTVPPNRRSEVEALASALSLSLHRVGVITQGCNIQLKSDQGVRVVNARSFNHFSAQVDSSE